MSYIKKIISAITDKRNKIWHNRLGVSTLAAIIATVIMISVISLSIAGVSSRKTQAELLAGSGSLYEDITRIEAPSFNAAPDMTDDTTYSETFNQSEVTSEEISVINDYLELVLPAVTTSAPFVDTTSEPETSLTVTETTVPVVETSSLPETTVIPETTAVPETTSVPETSTTPETNVSAPVIKNDNGLLVDKYNIEYDVITPTVSVSDEEIELTAAIIQLEVMGDGSKLENFDDTTLKYWEMLAVAMCIRNRAESSHFPDTVKEVILDSVTIDGKTYYQFSPANVLDSCDPTEEALAAAREVLCEGVTVLADNYYYFCASSIENRFETNNSYSLIKTDTGYAKVRGDTTTFYAGFYNE